MLILIFVAAALACANLQTADNQLTPTMGGGTGGDGGDRSPENFSAFIIMPMVGAWKESTSNDPRPPPPNRRAMAPPLTPTGTAPQPVGRFTVSL